MSNVKDAKVLVILRVEQRCLEPSGKRKFVRVIGTFEKSGGKIVVFDLKQGKACLLQNSGNFAQLSTKSLVVK